jgi:hypothetical protein
MSTRPRFVGADAEVYTKTDPAGVGDNYRLYSPEDGKASIHYNVPANKVEHHTIEQYSLDARVMRDTNQRVEWHRTNPALVALVARDGSVVFSDGDNAAVIDHSPAV